MANYFLTRLKTKQEVDHVIRNTEDKVLALRFGIENEPECLKLDEMLSNSFEELKNMLQIYTVELHDIELYKQYFQITISPVIIFWFNTFHLKCDFGTQDNSKWIGSFVNKQDFMDLIEKFYTGALHGKQIVECPIPTNRIPKYDILFKEV